MPFSFVLLSETHVSPLSALNNPDHAKTRSESLTSFCRIESGASVPTLLRTPNRSYGSGVLPPHAAHESHRVPRCDCRLDYHHCGCRHRKPRLPYGLSP